MHYIYIYRERERYRYRERETYIYIYIYVYISYYSILHCIVLQSCAFTSAPCESSSSVTGPQT